MQLSFLIGFFWGLFEGTWFFIIPDIALSYLALRGVKSAIVSTLATVLGAMVAATLLYFLIILDSTWIKSIKSIWSHFPGYYPAMLDTAAEHLRQSQARGLLTGPTSGIPYRFYVLEAFQQDISLGSLLFWTPLARLQRILIAPVAVLVLKYVFKKSGQRWYSFNFKKQMLSLIVIIAIYWICTYIWYWFDFLPNTYGVS